MTLTSQERTWLSKMPSWSDGTSGEGIATKFDDLTAERDEARLDAEVFKTRLAEEVRWNGETTALERAEQANTRLRDAIGGALTITRGGTVQMPKEHWDRIGAALADTEQETA